MVILFRDYMLEWKKGNINGIVSAQKNNATYVKIKFPRNKKSYQSDMERGGARGWKIWQKNRGGFVEEKKPRCNNFDFEKKEKWLMREVVGNL